MRYLYANALLPRDTRLLQRVDSAANVIHDKLAAIDLSELDISDYNRRYLRNKLANTVGTLQLYAYLIALSLDGAEETLDDFVFVDYGGGSGLMSVLASEIGIGRVIYTDIYDVSCSDAKQLASALDSKIQDYVCGDIDDLIAYVDAQSIQINAIASFDVIEHIYDIETYLRKLRLLSTFPFRIVFASTANMKNPLHMRRFRKTQLAAECSDRQGKWGHKKRDTLRSYLEVRREIIAACAPELGNDELRKLALLTRGLIKEDIEKAVDEYRAQGDIAYKPQHQTNTCDPYTGNWVEHLMDTRWLEGILNAEGFSVDVLSGYWSHSPKTHVRLIKFLLNAAIRSFGRKALHVAPYYVLYGDYSAIADV